MRKTNVQMGALVSTVNQTGSGRNRNRTAVPVFSSRTRRTRTRGSSVFLEDPKDPNPRFRALFFGYNTHKWHGASFRRPGHRHGVFVTNSRASAAEKRLKCAPFAL